MTIGRIDHALGYQLDNMQLEEWLENSSKGCVVVWRPGDPPLENCPF